LFSAQINYVFYPDVVDRNDNYKLDSGFEMSDSNYGNIPDFAIEATLQHSSNQVTGNIDCYISGFVDIIE